MVYGLIFFENRARIDKISFKDQFVMAYGGLRGAIAFALSFLLEEEIESRGVIITTTLICIWVTVFINGGTIKPILSILNVRRANKDKLSLAQQTFAYPLHTILASVNVISGHSEETILTSIWQYVFCFFVIYIVF